MSTKKINNRDAKELAEMAVNYAYSSPCCLCIGAGDKITPCSFGYRRKGSCPAYKRIRRKLIKAIEEEPHESS